MGHSEGDSKGKFCALRDVNCGHENYRTVCKPGWSDFFYYRGKTKITKGRYNAHHLVCVADVTREILGAWGIQGIIKQTDWCINREKNMLAMPLWGHTIKHYINIETGRRGVTPSIARRHKSGTSAPDFKDIPHHDSDHPSYQKQEVENEVIALVERIKRQKDKHKADPQSIAAELDDLSDYFRGELDERGNREKGTHQAWKDGKAGTNSSWYLPFSMAMDGLATKRTFPISNMGDIAEKILHMVNSFLNK